MSGLVFMVHVEARFLQAIPFYLVCGKPMGAAQESPIPPAVAGGGSATSRGSGFPK